jgi:hypothetical protein
MPFGGDNFGFFNIAHLLSPPENGGRFYQLLEPLAGT